MNATVSVIRIERLINISNHKLNKKNLGKNCHLKTITKIANKKTSQKFS
jgi:hypothetical protein